MSGVQGPMFWRRLHGRSVWSCSEEVSFLHCHEIVVLYLTFLSRTHYRRQKRWWSAYLLFYDRADQCPVFDGESFAVTPLCPSLPPSLLPQSITLSPIPFLTPSFPPCFPWPSSTEALQNTTTIPKPMKTIVHKQNLEFVHHKSHYNFTYFQFMKNFLIANSNHIKANLERNPHQTVSVVIITAYIDLCLENWS